MPKATGIDLILLIAGILLRGKRPILLFTGLTTVAAMIAVMVVSPTYRASGLIKPPRNESGSPIEAALKDAGGGLGGILGSFMSGSESAEDDCLNILGSTLFANLIIERFDLETVYEFKDKSSKYYKADVIKAFLQQVAVEVSEQGAIQIAVEDESPERAKEIVAYMIQALDSVYTSLQRANIRQRLAYVDNRVALAESELKRLEDSLVAFQLRHNLFLPEVQVQSIVENAARTELEIELVKEDMAMETALRGTSGSRYQNLVVQKRMLEKTMKHKLQDNSDPNSLVHAVRQIPALATDYFRLDRAYKVRLGVYKYLIQQAETLKLDADKNIQVVTTLDPPWVNDKKVAPKRRLIVEVVFALSLLLSSIGVLLHFLWQRKLGEGGRTRSLVADIRANLFRI